MFDTQNYDWFNQGNYEDNSDEIPNDNINTAYNDKKEEKEVKLEKLKTAITFQENNSLKDIIANSNLNVNDIENKVLLEKKNQKKKIN